MTITEAMRTALEQTQRINRLQIELVEATAARARAIEIFTPALAVQGQDTVLVLSPTPNSAALDPDNQISDG